MVSSPYYDNPYWEFHLPVNPPGAFRTDEDVVLDHVEINNWLDDDGEYRFRPRLKDTVQQTKTRRRRMRAVEDEDDD